MDNFAYETLEMTLDRQRRQRERDEHWNERVATAVRTGKPVLVGVWGPTGQRIFVQAETTGGSDEPR